MFFTLLTFALAPALSIFAGGIIASFRPPDKKTTSFVQHFAAGVVFAALAGEVLPDLTEGHPNPLLVIAGFAVGVALMLGMRWFIETRLTKGNPKAAADNPTTLILIVGIDVLIDGLLIGIGLGLGQVNGLLLTVALAIEILFLGLATGAEMLEAGNPRPVIFRTMAALAIPPIIGVFAGNLALSGVSHNVVVVLLAFAAAALLYLVTEELLVEAHEVPETPFSTAAFFVGFLVLYVLEMLV